VLDSKVRRVQKARLSFRRLNKNKEIQYLDAGERKKINYKKQGLHNLL
jgi:hypothetical protein